MPVEHYENFPVASLLLPARLRAPVEAIYAFARSADDVADEGDAPALARLARLNDYRLALEACAHGRTVSDPTLAPLFARLGAAIRQHTLPLQPLRDLLSAFAQDVGKTRYADFAELQDYCQRSANPVGRLMLHLYGAATPAHLQQSDPICTALQLINFWQDVAIDWRKQRIYLPQDDMARFGVDAALLEDCQRAGRVTPAAAPAWQALMTFQARRARAMMLAGAPLARALPGRIGWELRLVVLGGLRILDRLAAVDYDVFAQRPQLRRRDWLAIGWQALNYGKLQ